MIAFFPSTTSSLIKSLLRLGEVLFFEPFVKFVDFAIVKVDELLLLGLHRRFLVAGQSPEIGLELLFLVADFLSDLILDDHFASCTHAD